MKTKKILILTALVAFGIFIAPICLADVITTPGPIPNDPTDSWSVMAWIVNLIIEVFFAWVIFFRKNKKALMAVAIVNIVSQPIASLTYYYLGGALLFIEIGVVIFEMILYKLIINEITYKKAFIASLVLNILSLLIGFFAVMFFYAIFGLFVASNAGLY